MSQNRTELIPALLEAIEVDLIQSMDPLESQHNAQFQKMIQYHFGWLSDDQPIKGKRIRPLLTLMSCGAAGGDWKNALPVSSAIELIHNFSLIHDDIEDQSETRRGKATIWKRWGIPRAINLGDAIFVLSRLSVTRLTEFGVPAETIIQIADIIDQACFQLTIGQDLDLLFESQTLVSVDEYLTMITGKTSALLSAATSAGAIVASADSQLVESLRQFGTHLGLAFQIQDDILGIWGVPEKTGKSAGDDLRTRKKSLPVILGLNHSPEFVKLWEHGKSDKESLEAMRHSLRDAGALQEAEALSEKHSQQALASIDELNEKNEFVRELKSLALRLLNRQT
jgi:geranylgeranyl diphosphate synthase type I